MTTTPPQDQPPQKPRRKLTEAQLRQRREAAALSTGPRTEAGKARSSRNAWKHGMYSAAQQQAFSSGADSMAQLFGKPCRTTCPIHPDNPDRTEAPCSLVVEGRTSAGGSCLDKTVYVTAYAALLDAMEGGVMDGMQAMLAAEGASALQLIHQLRSEITNTGFQIPQYAVSKEGNVVIDPRTGDPMILDYKVSPLWGVLISMIDKMGISLPEMLSTPASRSRAKINEDTGDALTTILGAVMRQGGQHGAPPLQHDRPAIEHDDGSAST